MDVVLAVTKRGRSLTRSFQSATQHIFARSKSQPSYAEHKAMSGQMHNSLQDSHDWRRPLCEHFWKDDNNDKTAQNIELLTLAPQSPVRNQKMQGFFGSDKQWQRAGENMRKELLQINNLPVLEAKFKKLKLKPLQTPRIRQTISGLKQFGLNQDPITELDKASKRLKWQRKLMRDGSNPFFRVDTDDNDDEVETDSEIQPAIVKQHRSRSKVRNANLPMKKSAVTVQDIVEKRLSYPHEQNVYTKKDCKIKYQLLGKFASDGNAKSYGWRSFQNINVAAAGEEKFKLGAKALQSAVQRAFHVQIDPVPLPCDTNINASVEATEPSTTMCYNDYLVEINKLKKSVGSAMSCSLDEAQKSNEEVPKEEGNDPFVRSKLSQAATSRKFMLSQIHAGKKRGTEMAAGVEINATVTKIDQRAKSKTIRKAKQAAIRSSSAESLRRFDLENYDLQVRKNEQYSRKSGASETSAVQKAIAFASMENQQSSLKSQGGSPDSMKKSMELATKLHQKVNWNKKIEGEVKGEFENLYGNKTKGTNYGNYDESKASKYQLLLEQIDNEDRIKQSHLAAQKGGTKALKPTTANANATTHKKFDKTNEVIAAGIRKPRQAPNLKLDLMTIDKNLNLLNQKPRNEDARKHGISIAITATSELITQSRKKTRKVPPNLDLSDLLPPTKSTSASKKTVEAQNHDDKGTRNIQPPQPKNLGRIYQKPA